MDAVISLLKTVYQRNKLLFLAVMVIMGLFIVGCTAQGQGGPPPSGPIGGGC